MCIRLYCNAGRFHFLVSLPAPHVSAAPPVRTLGRSSLLLGSLGVSARMLRGMLSVFRVQVVRDSKAPPSPIAGVAFGAMFVYGF